MVYEFLYKDKNQKKCWFRAKGQSVYTVAYFIQNKNLKMEYIRSDLINQTIVVELLNNEDFQFPSYEDERLFYLFLKPDVNQQLSIDSVKHIYQYISKYNRVDLSGSITEDTWNKIFPNYNSIPVYPRDEDEYDDYFHHNIEENEYNLVHQKNEFCNLDEYIDEDNPDEYINDENLNQEFDDDMQQNTANNYE